MITSKKLYLISAAFLAVAPSTKLYSTTFKQTLGFGTTMAVLLPGPCLLARSAKNLSVAKALENTLKNPEVPLAPSLEEMAQSLKKCGRNGLILGTFFSLPMLVATARCYQTDMENEERKNNQEIPLEKPQ